MKPITYTTDQKLALAIQHRNQSVQALSPWMKRSARSQMRFFALSWRLARLHERKAA